MIDAGADIVNTATFDAAEVTPLSDDATTTISRTPSFTIVKDVDLASLSAPGTLTYTITVTNTGNVTLTGGAITDDLPVDFGGAAVSGLSIPVGGSVTRTATYAVTQAMIDAGADIVNTATFVAEGQEPESDDAVTTLNGTRSFTITKTVDQAELTAPGTLTYTITVVNTGTRSLTNPVMTDDLPVTITVPPTDTGAAGVLDAGETWVWTATLDVTQAMIDQGDDVVNTATFTADGVEPGTATATTTLAGTLSYTFVKTVDVTSLSAPGTLTYTLTATNTGTRALTNPVLTETLPVTFTQQPDDTGTKGVLDAGETWVWVATLEVTQAMIDAGEPIANAATFSTDDTPPTTDKVTTEVDYKPSFTIVKDADKDKVDEAGQVINYTITVTNTGNVSLTDVKLTDRLTQGSSDGRVALDFTKAPALASGDADGDDVLDVDEVWVYEASTTVKTEMLQQGRRDIRNLATIDTAELDPQSDDALTSVVIDTTNPDEEPEFKIEKTALRTHVKQGELVTWQIDVTNENEFTDRTLAVVDRLPAGFVFREGSATLDGRKVTPDEQGSRLVFRKVRVAAGQTVQIRLSTLVTGGVKPGVYTNYANIVRPFLEASASVTVDAEPVFDCGTVIGKVFHDKNRDGYQNPGEGGIAGARVVTVRGQLITTDEHGRFHVACADLPRDIGSNFAMKLDTRSLPKGHRVTTENPRVVRLTAGKMTEVNFGVAVTRVARIEVAANAFQAGTTKPKDEFVMALRRTVTRIKDTPVTIRISYQLAGESRAVAQSRMRAVEAVLRTYWPGNGAFRLVIEKTIKQ